MPPTSHPAPRSRASSARSPSPPARASSPARSASQRRRTPTPPRHKSLKPKGKREEPPANGKGEKEIAWLVGGLRGCELLADAREELLVASAQVGLRTAVHLPPLTSTPLPTPLPPRLLISAVPRSSLPRPHTHARLPPLSITSSPPPRQAMVTQKHSAGDKLISGKRTERALFLVESGEYNETTRSGRNRKKQLLTSHGEGGVFGELALRCDARRDTSVVCTTAGVVHVLTSQVKRPD